MEGQKEEYAAIEELKERMKRKPHSQSRTIIRRCLTWQI